MARCASSPRRPGRARSGRATDLGTIRARGKVVQAWAAEGDLDADASPLQHLHDGVASALRHRARVPEVDRAAWLPAGRSPRAHRPGAGQIPRPPGLTGPSKQVGTSAAAHPPRLDPAATLTCGCTLAVACGPRHPRLHPIGRTDHASTNPNVARSPFARAGRGLVRIRRGSTRRAFDFGDTEVTSASLPRCRVRRAVRPSRGDPRPHLEPPRRGFFGVAAGPFTVDGVPRRRRRRVDSDEETALAGVPAARRVPRRASPAAPAPGERWEAEADLDGGRRPLVRAGQ